MVLPETRFEESETDDILARVSLMESMIEQGRESNCRWGEFAVLWGVCSLIAYVWSAFAPNRHSWLWLDAVAYPLTLLLLLRRARIHRTITQAMRFVNSLWIVTGVAMDLVGFSGGLSAHVSARSINETVLVMIGTANLVSGTAFRWPLQIAVGGMWWVAAVLMLFASSQASFWIYCSTTFLGEICFGIYLMISERKYRYA